MTLDPTECYSKSDLDDHAAVLAEVAREAREMPGHGRSTPHRAAMHRLDEGALSDPARWVTTWRAHRRENGGEATAVTVPGG